LFAVALYFWRPLDIPEWSVTDHLSSLLSGSLSSLMPLLSRLQRPQWARAVALRLAFECVKPLGFTAMRSAAGLGKCRSSDTFLSLGDPTT